MAWLDFAPSDAGLEEFGVRHGIHTLHLEDCRSDEQQAKIEHGDGYLFIVLKLVLLTSEELSAADLDVFLGVDCEVHANGRTAVGDIDEPVRRGQIGEMVDLKDGIHGGLPEGG